MTGWTHWEEAVLFAVLSDLLLGDRGWLRRIFRSLRDYARAIILCGGRNVLRSDVLRGRRCEVGHIESGGCGKVFACVQARLARLGRLSRAS